MANKGNIFAMTDSLAMYRKELIRGQFSQIPSLRHILDNPNITDEQIYNMYTIYGSLRSQILTVQLSKQLTKSSCLILQKKFQDKIPLLEKIPFEKIQTTVNAEEHLAILYKITDPKNQKPPTILISVIKTMITDMLGESPMEFIQQSLQQMLPSEAAPQATGVEDLDQYYTQDMQEKLQEIRLNQNKMENAKMSNEEESINQEDEQMHDIEEEIKSPATLYEHNESTTYVENSPLNYPFDDNANAMLHEAYLDDIADSPSELLFTPVNSPASDYTVDEIIDNLDSDTQSQVASSPDRMTTPLNNEELVNRLINLVKPATPTRGRKRPL